MGTNSISSITFAKFSIVINFNLPVGLNQLLKYAGSLYGRRSSSTVIQTVSAFAGKNSLWRCLVVYSRKGSFPIQPFLFPCKTLTTLQGPVFSLVSLGELVNWPTTSPLGLGPTGAGPLGWSLHAQEAVMGLLLNTQYAGSRILIPPLSL